MHSMERIMWLGAVGPLSFPAIQWCAEQSITVLLLTRDGALLTTLTPEATADVRLRRALFLAQASGQDVVIARELVRRKLEGQRSTVEAHPELPDWERALEALTMALSWLSLPEPPGVACLDGAGAHVRGPGRAGVLCGLDGHVPLRWATKAEAKRVAPH
jgi:hypothetical protein